jgi:NAD-dependent SIR2 family protein deacetylase
MMRMSRLFQRANYRIVQNVIVYYDQVWFSSMNNFLVETTVEGANMIVSATDKVQEWLFDNHVDLILVIGTSGVVYPAAGYAWSVKMRGGKVAVFNIESDNDQQEDWMFDGITSEMMSLL